LKFLLKRELRHEDRAADQKEGKHKQHIKDSQARQLGERIGGNCADASKRETAVPTFHWRHN
jgi:hypothetical protein